jgi:hypothetical protein
MISGWIGMLCLIFTGHWFFAFIVFTILMLEDNGR